MCVCVCVKTVNFENGPRGRNSTVAFRARPHTDYTDYDRNVLAEFLEFHRFPPSRLRASYTTAPAVSEHVPISVQFTRAVTL